MKSIFLISGFVFIAACKPSSPAEKKSAENTDSTASVATPKSTQKSLQEIINEQSTEAHYEASSSSAYKTVTNDRYHFTFEIPSAWKAVDKSNNGDGYYIDCGDPSVDMRIYGEDLQGNPLLGELENSACDKKETIHFNDGTEGEKCYSKNEIYYIYNTKKTKITFYIKASPGFLQKNNSDIMHAVLSITQNGAV